MEWYHVLTIIAVNLGMYFHSQRQIGEFHKEVKDFHGRLCKLEEKYIHMMETIINEKK
jgi:hypothetical protein